MVSVGCAIAVRRWGLSTPSRLGFGQKESPMSLFALPVTVSDLTTLQQGITFATDTAAATAEAAQINNGADTVWNYAVRLLNSQISGAQVAMAVDSLMFGVTDNVAELSKLTNQFLP